MPVFILLIFLLLTACQTAPVKLEQSDEISPEDYDYYSYQPPVIGNNGGIATPHPIATDAAKKILQQGGNPIDAAVTASVMLTLVEPVASGIGGGGFMLVSQNGQVQSYDGRETAPTGSSPDMFLENGKPMEFYDAVVGGKGVGIPGLLRMLEKAHRQHGALPWKDLIMPVAEQAKAGFPISQRLYYHLSNDPYIKNNPAAKAYFFDGEQPKPVGTILKNPALANVLEQVANQGADAFYNETAKNIIDAVANADRHPKTIALKDFQQYRAIERTPICGLYRIYKVCGMSPPSAGGIVTIQALTFLEQFDLKSLDAATQIHLIAEATKRAYADRNAYIADPHFVKEDLILLVDADYLKQRGSSIFLDHNSGVAQAGNPFSEGKSHYQQFEPPSTSHISIMNGDMMVSLTSSVENLFGSRLMVDGFILNNQLTDFAFEPTNNGQPVNNAAAAGKRPRSSMSPTLVLDKDTGQPIMTIGSPGGSRITPYVIRALLAELGEIPALTKDGISKGNFVDRNTGVIELEQGVFSADVINGLKAKGHKVQEILLTSGINLVKQQNGQFIAKTDPRREGEAAGY